MFNQAITKSLVLFGKVLTPDIPQAVKVCIDKYVMDERLKMYFKEKNCEVYAFDTQTESCNVGDYILIRGFPESEDKAVKFNVEKIIYKRGYLIDPLSGRRCAGTEYIDEISRITELFGTPNRYNET